MCLSTNGLSLKELETADPTTSALILATAPVLTGFLAAIFLKERFTLRMVVGSLLAYYWHLFCGN